MTGPTTPDAQVLIVGGGVVGLSLLHALSARRVDALLIDSGTVGSHGASSIPAALLNPHRGRTGRASALDLAGLAATRRLVQRLDADGHDAGAHFGGVLRVASSARQAALWRGLAGTRHLSPADFPPHVRAPFGGMLVESGGWVRSGRLLSSLLAAAEARGARVIEGVRAQSVDRTDAAGVIGVATTGGNFSALQVVLALGTYDAASMGLPRLEHAPGLAVTFDMSRGRSTSSAVEPPLPAAPPRQPLAGAVGIVFVGSTVVVSGTAHDGDERDVERLRSSASWFVPAVASATSVDVWRGVRSRRASGVPVLRRLRPGLTLLGGFGGRGFLCAPLFSERLAERLVGQLTG